MAFTRTFPSSARVEIRCDDCDTDTSTAVFHYRDEHGQRRWKADHAAACSGRKGTTA